MYQTASGEKIVTKKEAREQLRFQIAQYVEQLSESTQKAHRWMKRLEAAGLGIIAAALIVAIYVSIAWKSVIPMMIPTAWFLFVASAAPLTVFVGLHTIILKAYPPVVKPGQPQKFVTGSKAIGYGWGIILVGLADAVFWGSIAYFTGTLNFPSLEPLIRILGSLLSVMIVFKILHSIYRSITRDR